MNHHQVIEDALLYIEKNIYEPLSLESVAESFNTSKYYFHRLFSAMMGCSLNNYILSRRLNAALKLLKNENLSLTDIAYQLNFGSQSSFTRAFKRQYGEAPSTLRSNASILSTEPIPPVVKRPIKNMNGDIVTDFSLTDFQTIRVSGIVFEIDLATEDFRGKIQSHLSLLLQHINETIHGKLFVIYSDCQPNSTRFKSIVGIPYDIQLDLPNYFTVDVPELFCARFIYSGNLLDISDVLETDFARFLKISKQESESADIELIQVFDDMHQLDSSYHIYTPVKKLPIDVHV